VTNVTNLLEKGEVPEHVKAEETAQPVQETVTQVAPVQEEVASAEEEKPFLMSSFVIRTQ
jgi:hypothetical protein